MAIIHTMTLNGRVYSEEVMDFMETAYRYSECFGDFYEKLEKSKYAIHEDDIDAAWDYFNN